MLTGPLYHSSVARGGAGGAIAPPIGLPTKMQNKENTTFLALLRLSFALDQTKNDLKHSLKRLFGGGLRDCRPKC